MRNIRYRGLSDEQLLSELLKGNSTCFGVLYSRYYSKVYSKCYSFSRNSDDAFDMTQEILMKVMWNASSFQGKSKFSTWLFSIATNYCISKTNKNSRNYHIDIKVANEILDERMAEEDYKARQKWEELEANIEEFLKLLSEEERQILILKYLKNYSIKDLQKEFALSASAIKMRLLRARMKMSRVIITEEAA